MNTIGRMFRVSMLGESHGQCVGVLLDGVPAGMELSEKDLLPDLERRKGGKRGTTPRKEADAPLIKSGVFKGKTTGAPVLILFENKDVDPSFYEKIKDTPRPGHADLVARIKYGGFNDHRGGGHFSGRLTAGLVAAGAVAKKMLGKMSVKAEIVEIGGARDEKGKEKAIDDALKEGDSIGGIVECRVAGLPAGLGEPFFDSSESLLSHAIFSIPAVKGVEFGAGFSCARMKGSECNDPIVSKEGRTATNNAGGINGGITNGNELVLRIAVKPTATIKKPGKTVNLETGDPIVSEPGGRHDACIALRVPAVLEAAVAVVLADLMIMEQRIGRLMKHEA